MKKFNVRRICLQEGTLADAEPDIIEGKSPIIKGKALIKNRHL